MNTSVINGIDFYNYFRSGVEQVKLNKDMLNKINVFPVKDGDTGTNLMMTMNSIAEETVVSQDFDVVIHSMTNIAFENARGNSGIIFASFINGFYNACGHLKSVTVEQFTEGANASVREVYSAVSTPVEGTILTIVREWASYLSLNYNKHHYFEELLTNAYERVKKVLEETPDMLDVLKKNQVVDAGAKGFVLFLEGINNIVLDKKKIDTPKIDTQKTDTQNVLHSHQLNDLVGSNSDASTEDFLEELPAFRYCTEILLYENIQSKDQLLELVQDLGDSVIVTGNTEITKMHVHTNAPSVVTKRLIEAHYTIKKSKVEDMHLQYEVNKNQRSKIAILTDSIADIEAKQILKEQIHVLPITLIADESVYLDRLTADKDNIETILDHSKVYPTSAQLDMKQISARLEWLLSIYEHVIIISVSSQLSGTWNSFKKSIEAMALTENQVTLVDSKLNSGAQGLVVLEAAKHANRGESVKQIVTQIQYDIQRASIYVSLNTFKYAVQGGRVPNTLGNILLRLNIKPIMSLNKEGHGTAFGMAIRRSTIDQMIFKKVKKIMKKEGINRYSIVHIGNEKLVERYQRILEEMTGKSPEIVTEISSITAIHAGIGAVAVALVSNRESLEAPYGN